MHCSVTVQISSYNLKLVKQSDNCFEISKELYGQKHLFYRIVKESDIIM